MEKREPTVFFKRFMAAFFGAASVLLVLYIGSAIMSGRYEIATDVTGKMSRNVNVVYCDSPWEILIWLIFQFHLLFFSLALAIRPLWFARKKILIPAGVSLFLFGLALNIIYLLGKG